MPSLLGIDSGLTVTKAVIFDIDGTPIAVARRRVTQFMPKARHIERDMDELWTATADAIAEAISLSRRPAVDIKAVAATAHGDGIYLLDRSRRPLGRAILSLDSRAGAIVDRWLESPVADEAHRAYRPIAARLGAIGAACLDQGKGTGPLCGDRPYHELQGLAALLPDRGRSAPIGRRQAPPSPMSKARIIRRMRSRLFGLEALVDALPPASRSDEIVGHVTRAAAALHGPCRRNTRRGRPARCHRVRSRCGWLRLGRGCGDCRHVFDQRNLVFRAARRQTLVLPQCHCARSVEQYVDLSGFDGELRLVP